MAITLMVMRLLQPGARVQFTDDDRITGTVASKSDLGGGAVQWGKGALVRYPAYQTFKVVS